MTLTGPRQAGKTTLCRTAFPRLPYANLEAPDERAAAVEDPRGFLARFPRGVILDEVQHVPALLSYLQGIVDADRRAGRFILTGSQHFGLLASVSQSLAGRSAVMHLLPLTHDEVRSFPKAPAGLLPTLVAGGYPAIHDRGVRPGEWLSSYAATYVERDVRQVLNVGDLAAFQSFMRLCAGRSGQVVNLSAMGADIGISHNTARAWLSVLEAGYVVFRVPPFHRNVNKRLTKSPKLYFHDTGLLCWLLGIRSASDLENHPLRGAIFETWVVSEILKARANAAEPADLYFYSEQGRTEVDLVIDTGSQLVAVEVKAGQTIVPEFFKGLDRLAAAVGDVPLDRVLVHGGSASHAHRGARVVPWDALGGETWGLRGARPRAR